MSWVAAAIGGGAALGAAGSIFGGIMGASGAQKSASAMEYAADQAASTALELNNRARADLAPFREMGLQTGNALRDLLLGGSSAAAVTQASPLFQFQSELGMRNLNRELASRGLFNSGAGLETLQRFNNQLVGEEADRLYTRLQNMTNMGQASAAGMATATNQAGANISNLQAQSGIAQGGAIANQYNAIGGAIQGGFNAMGNGLGSYAQYQMYQPLMQRLAGGGGQDRLFSAVDSASGPVSSTALTGGGF